MKKLIAFVFVCLGFAAKSQSLCAGSALTLQATPPASISPTSYQLYPGPFSSPTGSFVVSPTITTTYSLVTTGTSTAGTVTHTSVTTVTVNAQPSFAPSFTQTSCTSTANAFNLGLSFSPSNPAPSYTIGWLAFPPIATPNIPNGIVSSTQYTLSGGIFPSVYGATVQAAGGCTAQVIFTINPQPAPANFSVVPSGTTFSITCYNPTVSLATSDATYSYTWTANSTGQVVAPNIDLTSANVGSVVLAGTNPVSGCVSSKTLTIGMNTTAPQSLLSPTFQNITCNLASITTVSLYATTTTVNISHIITAPQGGSFVANTSTVSYLPQGGTGTYSYCLIDNVNGCSTCKTFSVQSSQGYPTFSLTASHEFTLGCGTKSFEVVNFVNGNTTPPGGAVSYSLLSPTSSTTTASGTLTGISQYTITQPGVWTAITKDNTTFCETRVPFSVTQTTLGPAISAVDIPNNILTCEVKSTTLTAYTEAPNVGFNWASPGPPVTNVSTSSLLVNANFTVPATQTLLATYTLSLRDVNSECITRSLVPIYQNVYLPNIGIVATPTAFTCSTPTIVLTNQSTTGIPLNSIFPRSQPVSGWIWEGPSPQQPAYITSTYYGLVAGIYTLTGKDMNNGCLRTGTLELKDAKEYPNVFVTSPAAFAIDCGKATTTLIAQTNPTVATASYTWFAPNTAPNKGSDKQIFEPSAPGIYTVLVTNTVNGCATRTVAQLVTQASVTALFETDIESGYAPLTVNFVNNSFSANNIKEGIITNWNYGNGGYSVTASSSFTGPASGYKVTSNTQMTFNQPGTYSVVAFVVKTPCVDSVMKVIRVETPSKLEIPNVFTPNGDNVNDVYFLRTGNVVDIQMEIYDRWGHKVYELISTTGNVAWDGKNRYGADCSEGTYFYKLKATGKDGKSWEEKGNITLIR